MDIRARACIKCKKYAIIHAMNPYNVEQIRFFEKTHRGHTLITVELNEIEKVYERVKLQEVMAVNS
ncbi:MAG: hypothetical protein ACFFA8_10085 [Promethearchaeota archaeon]